MQVIWIFVAALVGAILTVCVQIVAKTLLEPAYDIKKAIGTVRYVLAYHAPTIHTPIGRNEDSGKEAQDALRNCSAELLSLLVAAKGYRLVSKKWLSDLPAEKSVEAAAKNLRGLSNYNLCDSSEKADRHIDVIRKQVEKIENLLNLKPLE